MQEQANLEMLETEEKMDKTIESYNRELQSIRTGRANPQLLDQIMIEYYGVMTPIRQVGQVTMPEASQLYIKPYDKSVLKDIEKAIENSNLDLPPQNDGQGIRLIIPKMTEERRKELVKQVNKLEEGAKVAIRNIRRDANEKIKKLELTEDDEKGYLEGVQTLTDKKIKEVEVCTAKKNDELMHI